MSPLSADVDFQRILLAHRVGAAVEADAGDLLLAGGWASDDEVLELVGSLEKPPTQPGRILTQARILHALSFEAARDLARQWRVKLHQLRNIEDIGEDDHYIGPCVARWPSDQGAVEPGGNRVEFVFGNVVVLGQTPNSQAHNLFAQGSLPGRAMAIYRGQDYWVERYFCQSPDGKFRIRNL